MSTDVSTQCSIATRSFRALGTTATIVVRDAARVGEAESVLRAETEAIDLACSRFRPDSELAEFHANGGAPSKFRRCSTKLSTSPIRWPNGPTVPSTRQSAEQ